MPLAYAQSHNYIPFKRLPALGTLKNAKVLRKACGVLPDNAPEQNDALLAAYIEQRLRHQDMKALRRLTKRTTVSVEDLNVYLPDKCVLCCALRVCAAR